MKILKVNLRRTDVFVVVGGREATTGNTSALRRIPESKLGLRKLRVWPNIAVSTIVTATAKPH